MKIYTVLYINFKSKVTDINTFTDCAFAIKEAKEIIHRVDPSHCAILCDDSEVEDFSFVDDERMVSIRVSEVQTLNPYTDMGYLKAQLAIAEAVKPVAKPKFAWLSNWTDYNVEKVPLGFAANGTPILQNASYTYGALLSFELTDAQKKAISIARLRFLKSVNNTLVVETLDNGAVCRYGNNDLEYHVRNETELGKFVQENLLREVDELINSYRESSEEYYTPDEYTYSSSEEEG